MASAHRRAWLRGDRAGQQTALGTVLGGCRAIVVDLPKRREVGGVRRAG
jgi:hypothetical protein